MKQNPDRSLRTISSFGPSSMAEIDGKLKPLGAPLRDLKDSNPDGYTKFVDRHPDPESVQPGNALAERREAIKNAATQWMDENPEGKKLDEIKQADFVTLDDGSRFNVGMSIHNWRKPQSYSALPPALKIWLIANKHKVKYARTGVEASSAVVADAAPAVAEAAAAVGLTAVNVAANGDCFYTALIRAMRQAGHDGGWDVSVQGVRARLAQALAEDLVGSRTLARELEPTVRNALGDRSDGVRTEHVSDAEWADVLDLLGAMGEYNHAAGDIAPALAARVYGLRINTLQIVPGHPAGYQLPIGDGPAVTHMIRIADGPPGSEHWMAAHPANTPQVGPGQPEHSTVQLLSEKRLAELHRRADAWMKQNPGKSLTSIPSSGPSSMAEIDGEPKSLGAPLRKLEKSNSVGYTKFVDRHPDPESVQSGNTRAEQREAIKNAATQWMDENPEEKKLDEISKFDFVTRADGSRVNVGMSIHHWRNPQRFSALPSDLKIWLIANKHKVKYARTGVEASSAVVADAAPAVAEAAAAVGLTAVNVAANGDCFYTALIRAMRQAGHDGGWDVSVQGVRARLAQALAEDLVGSRTIARELEPTVRNALGDRSDGVRTEHVSDAEWAAVLDLLGAMGEYNHAAGDIAPALAARVYGLRINTLQIVPGHPAGYQLPIGDGPAVTHMIRIADGPPGSEHWMAAHPAGVSTGAGQGTSGAAQVQHGAAQTELRAGPSAVLPPGEAAMDTDTLSPGLSPDTAGGVADRFPLPSPSEGHGTPANESPALWLSHTGMEGDRQLPLIPPGTDDLSLPLWPGTGEMDIDDPSLIFPSEGPGPIDADWLAPLPSHLDETAPARNTETDFDIFMRTLSELDPADPLTQLPHTADEWNTDSAGFADTDWMDILSAETVPPIADITHGEQESAGHYPPSPLYAPDGPTAPHQPAAPTIEDPQLHWMTQVAGRLGLDVIEGSTNENSFYAALIEAMQPLRLPGWDNTSPESIRNQLAAELEVDLAHSGDYQQHLEPLLRELLSRTSRNGRDLTNQVSHEEWTHLVASLKTSSQAHTATDIAPTLAAAFFNLTIHVLDIDATHPHGLTHRIGTSTNNHIIPMIRLTTPPDITHWIAARYSAPMPDDRLAEWTDTPTHPDNNTWPTQLPPDRNMDPHQTDHPTPPPQHLGKHRSPSPQHLGNH